MCKKNTHKKKKQNMSPKLQPVRGTHDILPEEHRKYRHVVETARAVAERCNFHQMDTPIFESTEVFHRTLGDTSDVVTKETYTFTDRGGESLTLRPEFTASIARAFIFNNLKDQLPLRWFYAGPAFRYERPQKGRFRQFHQIGLEALGILSPIADIEVIQTGYTILMQLGLKDVRLEINTLGDEESRNAYRNALVNFFESHRQQLSEDSRLRLDRNPLRILDSKDESDRKIIVKAPRLSEYLSDDAKMFYGHVTAGLKALGIPFVENDRLVRGLDYYSHTVFEFISDALGAQNTVMAGGRYDKLISMMGGEETAGIGWAAGVERLMAIVDFARLPNFKSSLRPICMTPWQNEFDLGLLKVAQDVRDAGHIVEFLYKGNLGKRMKRANTLGAWAMVIFGEEELKRGAATVKILDTGDQTEVPLNQLVAHLTQLKTKIS
jgi:histidyl-tRNA synthetase